MRLRSRGGCVRVGPEAPLQIGGGAFERAFEIAMLPRGHVAVVGFHQRGAMVEGALEIGETAGIASRWWKVSAPTRRARRSNAASRSAVIALDRAAARLEVPGTSGMRAARSRRARLFSCERRQEPRCVATRGCG